MVKSNFDDMVSSKLSLGIMLMINISTTLSYDV